MLSIRQEIIEIKLITAVLEAMNRELRKRLLKIRYEARKEK